MQGQYQTNVFYRYAVTQMHIVCFFGYVQGCKAENSKLSHSKMAVEFIDLYNLDIDPLDLESSYYKFQKIMIDLAKELKHLQT